MKQRIFLLAVSIAMFAIIVSPAATAQLDQLSVDITDYEKNKVAPGETFTLQVKFYKPANIWISSGKIYAYLYKYDPSTQKSTCYSGDWTVTSASGYLYETDWGTWDAKDQTFSWSLSVDEDAPVGEQLRLRVRYRTNNPGLRQIKLKVSDNVYTGDNLRTYIKNKGKPYPTDNPTQWTLRYAPPLKVTYNEYYFDDYKDEIFVDYTLKDVTIQEAAAGRAFAIPTWLLIALGVIVLVIVIAVAAVKLKGRGPKEVPEVPPPPPEFISP